MHTQTGNHSNGNAKCDSETTYPKLQHSSFVPYGHDVFVAALELVPEELRSVHEGFLPVVVPHAKTGVGHGRVEVTDKCNTQRTWMRRSVNA